MTPINVKSVVAVFFLLPLLAFISVVNATVYDITKYGAIPGADISQALVSAWKEASSSTTPSTIVIPQGTWSLSQVKLEQNKAPLELQIRGTIKADPDVSKLPDKKGEWITINYVNYLTISGGGVLDGQGQQAWKQNDCGKNPNCAKLPINLSLNFINNSIIRDLTTKDSKNWHVNCISSNNVTFQHFTISAPGDSPNSDGIHVARSSLVNITDTIIGTGDDCVSIGDDTKELYITKVTCGPGHGISIGSLGKFATEKDVTGVYVKNCTFTETQNGIRVKTWPSAPGTLQVSQLHFEDLIMNKVSSPIIIDQQYCPWNQCKLDKPSLVKISNVHIKNVKGTSATQDAVTFVCSSSKPCENVEVGDIDLTFVGNPSNTTTKCINIKPTLVGKQNPPLCATKGPQSA